MRSSNLKLYGKLAALGLALTMTVALLIGPAFKASGASGVFVAQGFDQFTTPSDGNTYHNFYDNPIPAGFFNTAGSNGTSNQYTGAVPLKGVPLPNQGGADTVIQRNQDVTTPGTTTLTVVGLSLASVSPLNVSFTDNHTEQWNMTVGLSQLQSSTGSMTITDNGTGGGTFDSSISIIPRFTFTRVSDGAVKVWDTGTAPGAASPAGTRAAGTQSASGQGSALEVSRQAALAQAAAARPCIANTFNPEASNRTTTRASKTGSAAQTQSAAAAADLTGGGRPINLTSSNTPWSMSGGTFVPGPPNEQDTLRRHQPSPTPIPCRTISPM